MPPHIVRADAKKDARLDLVLLQQLQQARHVMGIKWRTKLK